MELTRLLEECRVMNEGRDEEMIARIRPRLTIEDSDQFKVEFLCFSLFWVFLYTKATDLRVVLCRRNLYESTAQFIVKSVQYILPLLEHDFTEGAFIINRQRGTARISPTPIQFRSLEAH